MADSKQDNTERMETGTDKTCHGQWLSEEYEPGMVSVIIPTYNRAPMLEDAVDSVLAQTYRPIECIVADDGSSDNTGLVIEEIRKRMDSSFTLRYIRQPNSGACSARNRGLVESRGEFINFLDSDDLFMPEAVQLKVERIQATCADYVYSQGVARNAKGRVCRYYGSPWPRPGAAVITPYLFHTNAPLLRRSACIRAGPWDESLAGCQEVDYFYRLKMCTGPGVFLPLVLFTVREHGGPRICCLGNLKYVSSAYKVTRQCYFRIRNTAFESPQELLSLSMRFLNWSYFLFSVNRTDQALESLELARETARRTRRLILGFCIRLSKALPRGLGLRLLFYGLFVKFRFKFLWHPAAFLKRRAVLFLRMHLSSSNRWIWGEHQH